MSTPAIISREDAKRAGLPRFFTGQACPHGHIAERFVSNGRCHECHRQRKMELRQQFPERFRQKSREKYASNPTVFRQATRAYYAKNSEKVRTARRNHYWRNLEASKRTNKEWKQQNRARIEAYAKRWRADNLDKMLATNAARRAGIGRASPAWVDKKAIAAIYKLRKAITAETGILHHVDHIIPLKGENVCGLHVPWNLRVIPAFDNLSKKNRLIDV